MSAGPIVNEISASFGMFWNSEWALPVAAARQLHRKKFRGRHRATEQDLQDCDVWKRLAGKTTGWIRYPIDEQLAGLRERLVQIRRLSSGRRAKFSSSSPPGLTTSADNVSRFALRFLCRRAHRMLPIERKAN